MRHGDGVGRDALESGERLRNLNRCKIVIVGGVAGGASAAARARRANANAEIVILEKGPVISFANCGLPYHIGGEITNREKLLVATPELFWNRLRVEVKTLHEAVAIHREKQTIEVVDHTTGQLSMMPYDRLILSIGSEPITPDTCLPLADNAFHLWTLRDMDRILAYLSQSRAQKAVVLGGGFVGLEVVEQLQRLGVQVTLIERNPQVLKPLDIEFARIVQSQLVDNGVTVLLNRQLQKLHQKNNVVSSVELDGATMVAADLLIIAAGIQPRIGLAQKAGLTIGKTQGVVVNEYMQTSDPNIYAVGDIAELVHGVTGETMRVPLAGPANRSGRIAGEHAATGQATKMGAVFGTAIVRVFDVTAACTGMNEAMLKARKVEFRSVIIQAMHHASYYPGAQSLQLKLLYAPKDGRILGGQAVGGDGVDKRIDIVAALMQQRGSVYDLAELDLTYAPPFGSAKDAVHMAAFAACNDLQKAPELLPTFASLYGWQVLDVRTATERAKLPLPNAIPIEIDSLAEGWTELDPSLPTLVVCHSGKRAHIGACWLRGKGFKEVRNLSGGMSIRSLDPGSASNSIVGS
jgi:NADPH-dependent 2,4-dienoyl-CoA reductase/sulfur reductase-like enzyme/rhodanese-related sulfurtransferase